MSPHGLDHRRAILSLNKNIVHETTLTVDRQTLKNVCGTESKVQFCRLANMKVTNVTTWKHPNLETSKSGLMKHPNLEMCPRSD